MDRDSPGCGVAHLEIGSLLHLGSGRCVGLLAQAGIDPADAYGPEVGEALQFLDTAPEYIRTADFLSLVERLRLTTATADAPAEIVLRAKEMAVTYLRRVRTDAGTDDSAILGEDALPNASVITVFEACVQRLLDDQRMAEADKLFADHDRLLDAVLAKLATSELVNGSLVAGRPAAEVLAERLRAMPPPEFALLAAGLLGIPEPGRHWLQAAGGGKAAAPKAVKRSAQPKKSVGTPADIFGSDVDKTSSL